MTKPLAQTIAEECARNLDAEYVLVYRAGMNPVEASELVSLFAAIIAPHLSMTPVAQTIAEEISAYISKVWRMDPKRNEYIAAIIAPHIAALEARALEGEKQLKEVTEHRDKLQADQDINDREFTEKVAQLATLERRLSDAKAQNQMRNDSVIRFIDAQVRRLEAEIEALKAQWNPAYDDGTNT
jgi:hypothetical protein